MSRRRPQQIQDPVAPVAPSPRPTPAAAPKVEPLREDRFRFQFSGNTALKEKLERAQDLLGYQVKRGDIAAIVDKALDELITSLEKKKRARTERPYKTVRKLKPGSRTCECPWSNEGIA